MLFRPDARIFSGCDCLSSRGEQKRTKISMTSFRFSSAVAGHHLWVPELRCASECFRVLLTPEAQQVSKPGTWRFIPRQKHDFGSVELHLGFKRVKMQITITMRNDTKFVESCFIRFISQNLQFWWNQSNFIWTLRAIYMN